MTFFKKVRDNYRSLGLSDSFWYACHSLLQAVSSDFALEKHYVVAQSTSRDHRLQRDHGKSITMREIMRDDAVLRSIPRDMDLIAMRFDQSARCFGAFKDEQLVGVIWLQENSYTEDEIRCQFVWSPKEAAVWSFDVFILPEHRMGLAFVKLWNDIDARLRKQGVLWTLSRISAFNLRSRASHQRLGLRVVGSCVFIILKNWQVMLSSRRPFLHLSISPRQYPRVALKAPD